MTGTTTESTVPEDVSRRLLETMVRIRQFENRSGDVYDQGEIPGFMHLSNGHEGSHAGIAVAKDDDDWWVPGGARINGQALAAGLSMDSVMAEMYGKRTGSNDGKGGHMHLSNVDEQFYGSAATIGQGPNPAAGFAVAQQMNETGNAVVSVVGDGSTTRGTFHTALNLAAVWELPVVFVIENNRFALSFNNEARLKGGDLADHAEKYGIPGKTIDGTDVELVYETVSDALQRAKRGDGPTVLEHKLHRLEGHYVGDKEDYREEDIETIRAEYDPVEKYREKLIEAGVLTEAEYEDIVAAAREDVDDAVEFARESEFPEPEAAYENLYETPLYGQEL